MVMLLAQRCNRTCTNWSYNLNDQIKEKCTKYLHIHTLRSYKINRKLIGGNEKNKISNTAFLGCDEFAEVKVSWLAIPISSKIVR